MNYYNEVETGKAIIVEAQGGKEKAKYGGALYAKI